RRRDFHRGAAAEVRAGDKNVARLDRSRKGRIDRLEQIALEHLLVERVALARGRDDVVGVDVVADQTRAPFQVDRHQPTSLGSVMRPVSAAAAQAAGEARKIDALALPMRALKLRFAVESTFMPSPGIAPPVPQQAPQPGVVTIAPIATNFASDPSA